MYCTNKNCVPGSTAAQALIGFLVAETRIWKYNHISIQYLYSEPYYMYVAMAPTRMTRVRTTVIMEKNTMKSCLRILCGSKWRGSREQYLLYGPFYSLHNAIRILEPAWYLGLGPWAAHAYTARLWGDPSNFYLL
jgi:hypothetical protein